MIKFFSVGNHYFFPAAWKEVSWIIRQTQVLRFQVERCFEAFGVIEFSIFRHTIEQFLRA